MLHTAAILTVLDLKSLMAFVQCYSAVDDMMGLNSAAVMLCEYSDVFGTGSSVLMTQTCDVSRTFACDRKFRRPSVRVAFRLCSC